MWDSNEEKHYFCLILIILITNVINVYASDVGQLKKDKETLSTYTNYPAVLQYFLKEDNKGSINRVSAHLDKHGWFYAEIVGLLGSVAMKTLKGSQKCSGRAIPFGR